MKKIISTHEISGSEYFKKAIKEHGYTARTFTNTYNNLHPERPICVAAVQSWSNGRRSLANASAQTVIKIAHTLSGDPDCSESDFDRYADIAYHLINGCTLPIYEKKDQ